MPAVNWEQLSLELGTLKRIDGKVTESVSGRDALNALVRILGDAEIVAAVKYYLDGRPGAELARFVLWKLKPAAAMAECYRVYKESKDMDRRRSAVELMRVAGDKSSLRWVPEFLADPDTGIQLWGIGVVDQLAQDGLIDQDDVQFLLAAATSHPNKAVAKQAAGIRKML